jgi:hypothetical protein
MREEGRKLPPACKKGMRDEGIGKERRREGGKEGRRK